jgi:UDP-N-acetylmuramoyl-tripeptide--D-alanyl-D-alanine ligase
MKRIKTLLAPLVLGYLRTIARIALSQSQATVIGVAGSVGKTSTREALFAILKDIAPTHMVSGNSETGVPLGLVGLFPHDYSPADWVRMMIAAPLRVGFLKNKRYIIVEMGIDDPYPPKNMGYLLTIVAPDIGIITEESAAHTMQFEKIFGPNMVISDTERLKLLIEAITKEDAKMIRHARCKLGIVNGDNTFLHSLRESKIMRFGRKSDAALRIGDYAVDTKKTTFSYMLGTTPIVLEFKDYAFPEDLAYVFAPAILATYKLNVPADTIQKNLERNFVPPRGRESVLAGINHSIIIDSSYNASKPSVLSFLELTATLKRQSHRHTIVVLADMLELGNESQVEHEAVAHAIGNIPDTLYLVGPLTKRFILPIVEKEHKDVEWFPSIIELNRALSNLPNRSLILFKGSQGDLWLEESIKLLLKHKEDVPRLCRQNAFWQKVKKAAGKWIEV